MTSNQLDLSKLEGFRFIADVGSEEAKTACLMSATAYLAGEPWGDHPECACPVLRSVGISLNDGPWWADDDERGEFVRQYAPLLIGTRSTPDVERKRANLLVRAALAMFAPSALDSAASALRLRGLNDHADKLADFAQQLRSDPSAELAREARRAADAAANAADAAYANAYGSADAAADAAASIAFEARQKARAEARRGVRAVLLQLFDEAIAITEAQPTAAGEV